MPVQTYYSYKKGFKNRTLKYGRKYSIDSAKYRATRLLERLEECELLAVKIRDDENIDPKDRLEAGRTACEAAANIFKTVNEGPTFRTSTKLPYKESINSNNERLPN